MSVRNYLSSFWRLFSSIISFSIAFVTEAPSLWYVWNAFIIWERIEIIIVRFSCFFRLLFTHTEPYCISYTGNIMKYGTNIFEKSEGTGQSISSLGKVPIEILPGKRHITWVLTVLPFSAEFQTEPLAPNVIYYYRQNPCNVTLSRQNFNRNLSE